MKPKSVDAEVLSVAAGNTYNFIMNHLIHACPNDRIGFKYRAAQFITFRKAKGGEMEALYEIDNVIVLNPYAMNLEDILDGIENSVSNRIRGYINERLTMCEFSYPREDYRFYILSEKGKIDLPHFPKPNVNNSGAWYYSLLELRSGKKIVEVESCKTEKIK